MDPVATTEPNSAVPVSSPAGETNGQANGRHLLHDPLPAETKTEALRLVVDSGLTAAEAARRTGTKAGTVQAWVRQHRRRNGGSHSCKADAQRDAAKEIRNKLATAIYQSIEETHALPADEAATALAALARAAAVLFGWGADRRAPRPGINEDERERAQAAALVERSLQERTN